jgi:hypothetical protein
MQKDEPATASSSSGQDSAASDPAFCQLVEHYASLMQSPASLDNLRAALRLTMDRMRSDASNFAPGQPLYGAYVDDFALIHIDWYDTQSDNLIDSTFLVGGSSHFTWLSVLLCSRM